MDVGARLQVLDGVREKELQEGEELQEQLNQVCPSHAGNVYVAAGKITCRTSPNHCSTSQLKHCTGYISAH